MEPFSNRVAIVSKTLLVIPHYNDVTRLALFLPDLLETLPPHFSILISDDGSTEKQKKLLLALTSKMKSHSGGEKAILLNPLFSARNTGKGGAVYRGWDHSEGFSLVAFTDADGAVCAREIVRTERFFRSEGCTAEALFANRVKMLGRTIHRSVYRHLSGRVFATLVSELARVPVFDTQCGLKILKSEAYQKICPYFSTQGFAFDVELLLLLLKSGFSVIEFPVDWKDISGSKVRLFRDSIRMSLEVLKIHKRVNSLHIVS